ncbi:Mg2+ transporter zinc transport protein [Lasiodiplodia theobromae]|uniref:Mg2+ transporter zinc transport protein n=1 Tax=Lasiodiplodia theobromae TaxID=45133 RepID=UPI0015C2F399|nr:Mg2+ transporter zinc transport protein [Lasiodiplodia theobromae]KAF4536201.1 Mg2+ transporter zinc transport protein [Lasiodiplodia theobromae]
MDSAPGFFSTSESNKITDIWDATVQSQQDHEENSDSSWTKTLRYTLAIIMSQKGLRINHRTSPDMFATAMDVLLQSTSPNGLFPVLLNSNKDPIHKMDQRKSSSHLQAMFEIPYVLFTYGESNPGNENDPEIQMPSDPKRDDSTISSVVPNTDSGKDGRTAHQHQERNSMQKANLRKTAPFNNLVDQKSIVDIEEEWLYNYPDFLDFTPQAPDGFKPSTYGPETGFSFVVDIPKSKRMSQAATTLPTAGQVLESLKNGGMGALVGKSRTAETAKRRFIMLSRIDREIRDLSNLISPPQESDNMESFIGRHMTFEKYFLDDTTAALNRWETELHLSYYLLFDPSKNLKTIKDERTVQFPGISKAIRQESLSFRLVGDFFNRYWTCHFVKDNQISEEAHTNLLELLAPRHAISKSERAKEPWRQRKVLELLLFDHMLEEIIAGTSDIILETKKQVLGKDEARIIEQRRSPNADPGDEAQSSALSDAVSLCKTNSIAYFAVNKQWQIFQQILEVVEDDITENLEKISEWNQREKERYLEKPRWTRNNERKYRGTISKLLASNERKILRLQRCRTNVQTLKNSLESRLQYMRDDLNAYFTTVTVIFLPLGFAAGIFSMNDDMPKAMVWHGMAFTSAAALGVTILVLVNAQKLAGAITASWNWGFRSPVAWLWQHLVNLSGWIQERTHGSHEAYNSNPSNAA